MEASMKVDEQKDRKINRREGATACEAAWDTPPRT